MDDLTEGTVTTVESPEQGLTEVTQEQQLEIASELLAMQDSDEETTEQALLHADGGATGTAIQPVEKVFVPSKTDLAQAEVVATEVAGFTFSMIQATTGREYGLSEDTAKEWAKGVSPCLVKYGLTDTAQVFSKWEPEIKAAMATGAVIFGMMKEQKRYEREAAHGNQSK